MLSPASPHRSIREELRQLKTITVGALVAFGLVAFVGLNLVRIGGTSYARVIEGKDLLADILPPPAYVVESYLELHEAANITDADVRMRHVAAIDGGRKAFDASYARWTALMKGEVLQPAVAEAERTGRAFFDIYERQVKPKLVAGNLDATRQLLEQQIRPAFEAHAAAIRKLVPLSTGLSAAAEVAARTKLWWTVGLLSLCLVAGVTVVLRVAQRISTTVSADIDATLSLLERMAAGDHSVEADENPQTEIGRIGVAINLTVAALRTMEGERAEVNFEMRQRGHDHRGSAQEMTARAVELLSVMNAAAEGDLSQEVTIKGDDPIGMIGEHFDVLLHSWRTTLGTIRESAASLSGAASRLTGMAQEIGADARRSAEQTSATSNASSLVLGSVQSVAAATDQMSGAIAEIARNASGATGIARKAVDESVRAASIMRRLHGASAQIATVSELIARIAAQTNLLALNATIEAARAGEHGRGFAVVSHEVKALAQETDRATRGITEQLTTLRAETDAAVAALEGIHHIVEEISSTQATIASAVEEQTATTTEMSRSVAEAALGTRNIDGAISSLSESARAGLGRAEDTTAAAQELANLATTLSNIVGQFKVGTEHGSTGTHSSRVSVGA